MRRDLVSLIVFLAMGLTIILSKPPTNHSLPQPMLPPLAAVPPVQSVARAAISAAIVTPTPTPIATTQPPAQPTTAAPSGDKYSWMAAAGIPQSDWQYVDYIVTKESGWNPNAVNSTSGACGLGQQLPCGKWPGAWNDPVAALRDQHAYVVARYGSYAGAHSFWLQNSWY